MDPFGTDKSAASTDFLTAASPKGEDFASCGVFKSAFTGTSFDDIDDLKPAPSDELAADAAAAATESEPTALVEDAPSSEKSPSDEAVLVSSS